MYSENIHEAKTHLSHLIEKAIAGEEIVISKAATERRPLGIWRGKVSMEQDFDKLPPEIISAFLEEHE